MPSFPSLIVTIDQELVASEVRQGDEEVLVAACTDATTRLWLPLPDPYTPELAREWCAAIAPAMRTAGTGLVLAVREHGDMVANIDAKRVDWRARTCELSYWTAPHARGRGILPRALRAIAESLIRELGFERIELRIAPKNAASLRVAEKAGFLREGTARNAGFTDAGRNDLVIWSLIPEDL
ncbi:GNAT family N-acetyltransferase [Microbacterium sorbitolivorans]|uniref:GNAT family N-acetyltransferase n=1 Tax=Microbacterium sorbitolivorans TaxID=1867410 RepID=UPI0013B06383|nr:GNAT family N-acetyltransferase [Microbacterium sorbitolivorans]